MDSFIVDDEADDEDFYCPFCKSIIFKMPDEHQETVEETYCKHVLISGSDDEVDFISKNVNLDIRYLESCRCDTKELTESIVTHFIELGFEAKMYIFGDYELRGYLGLYDDSTKELNEKE